MPVVVTPPADDAPAGSGPALRTAEGFSGLGVSLLVHGVVLLAAALWAVDATGGLPGLSITSMTGEPADEVSLDLIDTSLPAGASEAVLQAPPVDPEPVLTAELAAFAAAPAAETPAASVLGAGVGEAAGDADGGGQRTVFLESGQPAIRAGSFTVWTIPADPAPMQNYLIVIRVDLPENLLRGRKYPLRDLYGYVRGTDGYRKQLPHPDARRRRGFLPIKNGQVELVVGVKGAEGKVRDRIKVGSRLLNESQELQLVF